MTCAELDGQDGSPACGGRMVLILDRARSLLARQGRPWNYGSNSSSEAS